MGTPAAEIPNLQVTYAIGHADMFTPEAPRHVVRLDAFGIDAHEVTNAQFLAFVEAQPQWRPARTSAFVAPGPRSDCTDLPRAHR